MYGQYNLPLKIEKNNISIEIKEDNKLTKYNRDVLGEKIEKKLFFQDAQIILNPVEPLNKSNQISSYLQVEFENEIFIEPKSTKSIYITFPIEIGILAYSNNIFESLDILSLIRPKYTLYGTPKEGYICRYWKSNIYADIPKTNNLEKGVIKLKITNNINKWTSIHHVIFRATDMKIYYNDEIVSMKAFMDITQKNIAETGFFDKSIAKNMKKSVELYSIRKIPIIGKKMIMEWGL